MSECIEHNSPSEGGGGGGGDVRWVTAPFGIDFLPFFVVAFLLGIEVGDVRIYPYPVSGKLTQIF